MSKEYFEVFGVLLGLYAFFRLFIWSAFWVDSHPPPSSGDWEAHPLDASHIAQRLQEVRQDYTRKARARGATSAKQFRVGERRKKIAKLAFFQRPPPPAPEPPEHDHGLLFISL